MREHCLAWLPQAVAVMGSSDSYPRPSSEGTRGQDWPGCGYWNQIQAQPLLALMDEQACGEGLFPGELLLRWEPKGKKGEDSACDRQFR